MLYFFTSLIFYSFASFAYSPSTTLIEDPSSKELENRQSPSIQESNAPPLNNLPLPSQDEQLDPLQPALNNNPNIYSNPFATDQNPSIPSKENPMQNTAELEEWSLPVEDNQNTVFYEKTQLEDKGKKYRFSLQGYAIPFKKESQSKKLVLLNLYTDFAWVWDSFEIGPFAMTDLALRLGTFNDLEELDLILGGFIEYHFFKTSRRFDSSIGVQAGYSNRLLSQNRLYIYPYLSLKIFFSSQSALNLSAGPFGFISLDSHIDYGVAFPRFGFMHYF